MTRTINIMCVFIFVLLGAASGEIDKTKHDMIYYFGTGADKQGGGSEACTFCHHPAYKELSKEQLWDSSTWGEPAEQGFRVYYSEDGDPMLICLSCHDGVISSDIFSDNRSDNNHPVGFDYVQLSFEKRQFPYYNYRLDGVKGAVSGEVYPLINNKMECVTCHDPHEGEAHFVRGGKKSLHSSLLCVDCHLCESDQCDAPGK